MKIMILDGKDSAALLQGLLSPYYDVVHEDNPNGITERVKEESPDLLLISSGFSDFGWEDVIYKFEREISNFPRIAVIVLASSPSSDIVNGVHKHGVDMIVRPFEPISFLTRLSEDVKKKIPPKERTDGATGLHKKGFTEDKIRERIGKSAGVMFLIDVAKYSFAASYISDDIIKMCAEIIEADVSGRGGTLGKAAGARFIGFIPNVKDRADGIKWGNALAEKVKAAAPEKLYVSVGLAEAGGENAASYPDLYMLCDKALGLARSSTKSAAAYY